MRKTLRLDLWKWLAVDRCRRRLARLVFRRAASAPAERYRHPHAVGAGRRAFPISKSFIRQAAHPLWRICVFVLMQTGLSANAERAALYRAVQGAGNLGAGGACRAADRPRRLGGRAVRPDRLGCRVGLGAVDQPGGVSRRRFAQPLAQPHADRADGADDRVRLLGGDGGGTQPARTRENVPWKDAALSVRGAVFSAR